jgi:hypothetical protein
VRAGQDEQGGGKLIYNFFLSSILLLKLELVPFTMQIIEDKLKSELGRTTSMVFNELLIICLKVILAVRL